MQVQVLVFEPCLILLHFVPLCVSLEQPTTWHLMGLWLFANSFLHTAQGCPVRRNVFFGQLACLWLIGVSGKSGWFLSLFTLIWVFVFVYCTG